MGKVSRADTYASIANKTPPYWFYAIMDSDMRWAIRELRKDGYIISYDRRIGAYVYEGNRDDDD